jgi:ADP-ribosylglycohydrolase
MTYSKLQRCVGCLTGLATGDAIGKQTETLKPSEIALWYPNGVTGFHGDLGSVIPRYKNWRYEWRVGETTDDTEQTLAVARALLSDQPFTHSLVGKELMTCKKSNRPTLSLGRFQQKKDPDAIATDGDGCGAAMRIAPVGLRYSYTKITELVETATQASISTHGGYIAVSAASAVAAAISAALHKCAKEDIITVAYEAARATTRYIPTDKHEPFEPYLEQMYTELKEIPVSKLLGYLLAKPLLPNHTVEIVPLAITLAVITESAAQTTLLATNLGGDTDSVAAIGSALAGTINPDSVRVDWLECVEKVNQHNLRDLAIQLAA